MAILNHFSGSDVCPDVISAIWTWGFHSGFSRKSTIDVENSTHRIVKGESWKRATRAHAMPVETAQAPANGMMPIATPARS